MFQTIRSNPVFKQLTAHRRWPSVRVAFLIWVLLTIGELAWLNAMSAPDGSISVNDTLPYWILKLILLLGSPFVAGIITAIIIGQVIHNDAFSLLLLSNLSDREIIRGYLWAVVYRLRVLWAICFTLLLPLLLFSLLHCSQQFSPAGCLDWNDWKEFIVFVFSISVFHLGFCVLAIYTGLAVALKSRSQWSGIWASVGTAIVGMFLTGIFIFLWVMNSWEAPRYLFQHPIRLAAAVTICISTLLISANWGLIRLAEAGLRSTRSSH